MESKTIILRLECVGFKYESSLKKDKHLVLKEINLNVRQGHIYGLLGASGCGKTTLLRLILGQISPSNGKIRLFNSEIDAKHKPLPSSIGYMPQDFVLYSELTPVEMLSYFGRLYQMTPENMEKRIDGLFKLLQLDQVHQNQLIKKLSGGQKRRVSLAIAMIHQPKFLILDEPTVGLDPVLRQVIWTHLKCLTENMGVSVLLTTHCIEETRFAQMIGFLRNGRLLSEDSPESLLQKFSTDSMEQVFLKLCLQNELETDSASTSQIDKNKGQQKKGLFSIKIFSNLEPPSSKMMRRCSREYDHSICCTHLSTLIKKNFRQVYRNSSLLLFFIFLPAIEVALIMLCIGRDINHIPIAVFNDEKPDLSELFLDSVPEKAFNLHYFDSLNAALDEVYRNRAMALLYFNQHFSVAFRSRFFSFGFLDDEQNQNQSTILNDSSVYVRLDMANQLIGLQIQRQLLSTFLTFAQRLALTLGLSNQTFKPPISFGPPVYGIQSSAIVETFIAPGALVMIAFFATTIVTCHLLIHEVRSELIERALIAGASTTEFLLAHILIQSAILFVQLILMLVVAFRCFAMPYVGSLPLSISLIALQGFCGLMYGLMLSATCPDEIYATTLAIGTFFPSVIIGGIFWPVESMPVVLQFVSQLTPSTQSIDALRSILLRDYGISHYKIAAAFLVSTFWLAMFLVCAFKNFKKRISN